MQMLWSEVELTDAEVDHIMETLQSCVVKPNEMAAFLDLSPQAIVLRNNLKPFLNKHLALNHARNLNQRVIVWRAVDVCHDTKRQLSAEVLNELDRLPPSDTGDMPTYMMFFVGCKYVFTDNENPELCWVNNYTSTGVRIILDKDEPDDDPNKTCWVLKKPPAYICVRPDNTTLGKVAKAAIVPIHCLPVDQKKTSFQVCDLLMSIERILYIYHFTSLSKSMFCRAQIKFPEPKRLYNDEDNVDCNYTVRVSRRGVGSTTLGYVFSDYFAQGCTWGKAAFFLHLLTSDSFYKAANLRVPITRATSIEGVKLLAPLWIEGDKGVSRAAFKELLKTALKPDQDYVAEMTRLRALDEATRERFSKDWNACQNVVQSLIEARKAGETKAGQEPISP